MKRLSVLIVTVAVLLTACGSTGETTTTTAVPATTAAPTTTTTIATATTTAMAPPTTTTTLPGEPIDFGPAAGNQVAVVGVAYDDVLNLRAAPGTDQEILLGLAPTYADMVAKGNARVLPSSLWYEVDAAGAIGWVSSRFVAYIGATDDITALVVDRVGEIPSAETMLDLADIVANVMKSQGEPESRLTVTVAPDVGDVGDVTIDIIGFGDDALFGLRLVIFGQPLESGEGFSLMSVESTALCGRGVSAEGLCA